MEFTLEQLRTFLAVAEAGSFSAAARRLHKTQSAVSTMISNLEIDLGVELFHRTGYKPEITAAGKHLLIEAEALLMRSRALQERASAFTENTETQLVVAMDDAIPLATFRTALNDWQSAYPTVELRIVHPTIAEVPRLLSGGRIDLAVMFVQPDYPKDVMFRRLGLLKMVEAIHRSHPLAAATKVTFEDLSDHRQLIFAPHGHAIATSEYIVSPRRYVTESYLSLLDMLRQGLGWAVIPYRLVSRELAGGILKKIDMAAYPHTPWLVGVDLLWSRQRGLGRAGHTLRELLAKTSISDD